MMMKQPEALSLAEITRYCFRSEGMSDPPEQCESPTGGMVDYFDHVSIGKALLARIEWLESQLEAIGAGGVEPLRKRECLHKIEEPSSGTLDKIMSLADMYIHAATTDGCPVDRLPRNVLRRAIAEALAAAPAQAQEDAKDAARYRFLRDGEWRRTDLESVIRLQLSALWDAKIDAAIAAQQGAKP